MCAWYQLVPGVITSYPCQPLSAYHHYHHYHHHRHLCRVPIIEMQDEALQAPAINIASVSTVNTMIWLGLILMLDCCLVLCTVQANISSVCCVTRILILDHRRSWVIFRGGPTIPSCQNSILSCQHFFLSGGGQVLQFCPAKLPC